MPRAVQTVQEAAAGYAARGFACVPLHTIINGRCTCGTDCGRDAGKHPHTVLVPNGLKDASTDPAQIGRWFRAYPDLNIGIVLRGLVAIDEDEPGSILGAGLELPNGPVSRTGRGHHYLFKLNGGRALLNGDFAPGLDCKTGEAYVVAPPSRHQSGKRYTWVVGHSLEDVELPPLPEAVEQLIVAAHAGKGNGAAKDDVHDLFGNLKLEAVFLEIEAAEATGNGDLWRRRVLQIIASVIGRMRDDDIMSLCRRATWRQAGWSHTQTDEFVRIEIGRARAKFDRPEPDEDTFDQVDGEATVSDPWPEPIDVIGAPELVGWPELTSECLPASLHRYVTGEAERLNVDPCPLAAHVLAACAASISDAWRIKPKKHDHWTQQARIWTCVVKDVGARGTEIIRSAFWPVKKRENKLFDEWRRDHAAWKEQQGGKKKGEPPDPEPQQKRLTTNDATIESASDILAKGDDHAKVAMICDELVSFLGGFSRYTPNGAAGRALWLESYDGGAQRIDRIKRGHIYVPNWSVVVAGNIQPRRLSGMAKDLVDDGLFQRFLTIHTKPATLGLDDDRPLSTDAGRDYRELHDTLAELRPVTGAKGDLRPAFFDDDAQAVRRGFIPLIERLQVDPTLPTIIRETAPKWSGLLARHSLIFHLVDLADSQRNGAVPEPADLCRVSGPTVTAAATFLRRIALPNLFRLGFETMPEEGAPVGHARWLAGYILAHQSEHVTAREIGRAYRPLRGKPAEIEGAMSVLVHAGWAGFAEGRHDGARWAINPAVHPLFAGAAAAERERRAKVTQDIGAEVADFVGGASPEALADLLRQGFSVEEAAKKLGISRATAFRWKGAAS